MAKKVFKLELAYFYGKESESFSFCRLPKLLFSDPRLKEITTDGKVLYSFMLDRVPLSVQNNWQDEEGRVYIIFTNEEAQETLGKCSRSITKLMNELEQDFGLIERKKRGLGKPDLIYVKNFASLPQEQGTENQVKNSKLIPESPQTQGETVPFPEKLSTISAEISIHPSATLQDVSAQNDTTCSSRVVNVASQDWQKVSAIKTDITNTDQSKTDFIKPTIPPNPKPTFPQSQPEEAWEEGWTDLDKEEKISVIDYEIEKNFQRGKEDLTTLLYQYRTSESKMETALYVLTGMEESEQRQENHEEYSKTHFYFRTKKLYARALLEMLTTTSLTKTKLGNISYSKVIEKLVEHIVCDPYSYNVQFDSIMDCTIQAYRVANKESDIKFPIPYMKSCIWTVLCEGNIRGEADFQRLYG